MNLNPLAKYYTWKDIGWSVLALSVGVAIVYVGDRLLNVSLEVYYGVATYNMVWVATLIVVPLIAGFCVSAIYGLGGKILAHFAPLIVRVFEYNTMDTAAFPDGVTMLPLGFWILIVIVSVEAAAVGGFIGEVVLKRTYGRSPKSLLHKRYQTQAKDNTTDKT